MSPFQSHGVVMALTPVTGVSYSEARHQQLEFHMDEPTIAQKAPYGVDVEEGKAYFWCACGKSASQPFCDGSHQDTSFLPMKFEATESKTLYFCGCKKTGGAPLCDGTHNGL